MLSILRITLCASWLQKSHDKVLSLSLTSIKMAIIPHRKHPELIRTSITVGPLTEDTFITIPKLCNREIYETKICLKYS